MATKATIYYEEKNSLLICEGDWDLVNLNDLQRQIKKIPFKNNKTTAVPADPYAMGESKGGETQHKNKEAFPRFSAGIADKTIILDGKKITKLDSAGALCLVNLINYLHGENFAICLAHFSKEQQTLINIVKAQPLETLTPAVKRFNFLARLGLWTDHQLTSLNQFLSFIGKLTLEAIRIFAKPTHFRINALSHVIYQNGYQALPIIALLSFMIGVVITYQMGLQLRTYGANMYIVDLLGLSILREFSPLLTSIMVAGRTGSAFTAQIGIMRINQEIDALDTMGVTPSELLLLPRIFGLIIVLPLLTIWSDIFGVLGGMLMSYNMLGIGWYDFLHRFANVIPLKTLIIGLGKAPVFALIISSIGCFQGMRVEGSADSVGRNTTRSVVLAIFFIIVADAMFSVIFSKLKL
jgi:phospholipid/cholesterol/gamma-HCH transport system permease protein